MKNAKLEFDVKSVRTFVNSFDTLEKLRAFDNFVLCASNLRRLELNRKIKSIWEGDVCEVTFEDKVYKGVIRGWHYENAKGIIFELKTGSKKYPWLDCEPEELVIISQNGHKKPKNKYSFNGQALTT